MNRTLISAVMSSLLYQLSYDLLHADKGFEPLYFGHEPPMLPLHQPAIKKENGLCRLRSDTFFLDKKNIYQLN